jgi:hypothetical protein
MTIRIPFEVDASKLKELQNKYESLLDWQDKILTTSIAELEKDVANFKWLAQRRLEELELIASGSESPKAKALIAYYQNHKETF